jgi:hypothetical protein
MPRDLRQHQNYDEDRGRIVRPRRQPNRADMTYDAPLELELDPPLSDAGDEKNHHRSRS